MKVGTFKRVSVKALPNWLPCCATVQQCDHLSVPKGPHGRSNNQEFGTRAAWCVAKKLLSSPFFLAFSMICLKPARAAKGSSGY